MSVNHRGVCQIAFRSNPGDASYVWDDVSRWLMEFQTHRGRQYELNSFQAGTANVVFDNSYRLFDPSNLAGPYAPNVLPMKPIRVGAQRNLLAAIDALAQGGSYSWASLVNCAITQNASDPPAVTAWQLTPSGAGNMSTTSAAVTVFPGEPLVAMAQFVGTVSGRSCRVDVNFTTATGTAVSTVTGTPVADNTSTFTNVTTAVTVPATAALATITLTVLSTSGATDKHWFNKVGLIPADDAATPAWCAGGIFWRFTGYVQNWPPEAHDPEYSVITIQAADGLAALSQATLPPSVYYSTVLADGPSLWYRLGDSGAATTAIDSSGNNKPGTYAATVHTAASLIYGDADGAITFDGSTQWVTAPGVIASSPFTLECWAQIPTSLTGSGSTIEYTILSTLTGTVSNFFIKYIVDWVGGTHTLRFQTTGGAVDVVGDKRGQTLHLVMATNVDGTADACYVNGVNVGGFSEGIVTAYPIALTVGAKPDHSSPFNGVIDEVAVYPTKLGSTAVAAHYAAGTTPWANDTSGQRVGRILDAIAWPSALRAIDAGVSILAPANWGTNTTALSYGQSIEKSEQGRLFVDAKGNVTFRSRYITLGVASALTFSDLAADLAGSAIAYSEAKPDTNANLLRNVVTAQQVGGSPYTVSDATSKTAYLTRLDQVTGLLNVSNLEVIDLANWRLSHYKNPVQRWQYVAFDFSGAGNDWATFALREIGDRVTMKRNPPGGGTPVVADQIIEGIADHWVGHGTQAGQWTTQVNLSPVDTQAYLILDDPTYGQLDSNALAF